MAKKVKEQMVLMVKVPGYQIETPVIIDYESIWSNEEGIWKFQIWFDWCKQFIHVTGRFTKDGLMSRKNISVSMSRMAETFYHNPSQCEPIQNFYILEFK
jgi:hypothetical protein